nr:MAG TPA: hypothetical protein [Caudoviricetes sp.]
MLPRGRSMFAALLFLKEKHEKVRYTGAELTDR